MDEYRGLDTYTSQGMFFDSGYHKSIGTKDLVSCIILLAWRLR